MNERDPLAAQAHALFERVIDLAAPERAAVLAEACADRPELRARVDALLASDAAGNTLLDAESCNLLTVLLDEQDEAIAAQIGSYHIVEEIGRGGMGAVYRAERADGEFEHQVALKLVKRGMDTDEIIARFRHERRILASLEHPNIARLFDGGVSEDGRPYLVMELVRGEPITLYCDRLRLDVDARLALFRTICTAVQHAHQKLVVHRDIKPSNILVAEDGTPKLLDFGIAKLLDEAEDAAPRTRTGVRVLTPEYAAPEQMRGEPVTTATDVFALGTVLYQLLTGRRPSEGGQGAGGAERPSAIVQRAPARTTLDARVTAESVAAQRATTPERLRRRLTGDLDVILLRALDPDPARRYGSAQQLTDDIARHQLGLPIQARAPTVAYLARKFARRHRSGLAAAALVLLSLLAGLGATLWQARAAAAERDAAELARRSSDQVASFLLNMFDSADPLGVRPERTDTLRVRDIIDRGAARVRAGLADQPRVQATMLTTLGRVYSNLGDFASAERMLRDALEVLDAGTDANADRAAALSLLAAAAREQGEFARADTLLERVLALYDTGDLPPDSLYAASMSERGVVLMNLGEYDAALALHERALALIAQLGATGTPLHATALGNLALHHYQAGDYARAEEVFRAALELEESYLSPGHPRLATTLNNIASAVQYQGRLDEAEPLYLEAIAIARASLGAEHAELGSYLQNLASLYDDQERYSESEPVYRESIRVHEAALGRTNPNTALLLRNFALNRYTLGELEEAEALLREALASMTEALGPDHLYTAVTAAALGRVLTARGRLDDALPHIRSGLATLAAELPAEHHLVAGSRRDLGHWYALHGDFTAAEPLLRDSYATLLADRGQDHYLTREARQYLHELYVSWGKPDIAASYTEAP